MEALYRYVGNIIQDYKGTIAPGRGGEAAAAHIRPPYTRKKEKSTGRKRASSRKPDTRGLDFKRVIENSMASASVNGEAGSRSRLLNSFQRASHGDLESFGRLHQEALQNDPIFYGHIARWYQEKGAVRDHHELFAAHLLSSPFPEHRENGTVLLQYLRPYQVARVVRYCKETLHFNTRALKSAVKFYLKRREENPLWFDEHVIRRRDVLKYLYATLHIKPGERAEKVLFMNRPPKESRVHIAGRLKSLAGRPDDQARLIVNHRLHYTACIGAIKDFTPAILYALAFVMTPQQVINNLKFFEKRGALKAPRTRAVIEEKLRYGAQESRVSDFKSMVALSKLNADSDLAKELLRLTATRVRNRGEINVPTALFVDKSGSMERCIEIGKLLATMCSSIATSDLHVCAFDTNSFEIKPKDREFASWERAFAPVRANNATSIGAPFMKLMNREIDQVVVITDGEENAPPKFRDTLDTYEGLHRKKLRVIMVKVSASALTPLEKDMEDRDMMVIPFEGDYYSLPNVIPFLCSGNNHELVEEVLSVKLYTKENLATLPMQFNEETFEVL